MVTGPGYFLLTSISNVSLCYGKSIGPPGRPCTKLSTPTTFHTLKHWYQYTDLELYFFKVLPFFWKNRSFTKKLKETLSSAIFLESFIVAPLFLDMCLQVFGAWINQNNVFVCDIFLENKIYFQKKLFLRQKLLSLLWTKFSLQPSFIQTKTLIPMTMYRFRAITFFKDYLNYNRLSLNIPKCEFMLIGTFQTLAKMPDIHVHIDNGPLNQVTVAIYLGIFIDSNHKCVDHINKLIPKIFCQNRKS